VIHPGPLQYRAAQTWAAVILIGLAAIPVRAAAQDNAIGNIQVRPNLGTQTRDQFVVCTGTTANRALYGSKVTSSTGDVSFTGIPSGIEVVTTVVKAGFTGREQKWLVPPPGSSRNVLIYMFSGTGGPVCPGTPSTPPAPSTVRIVVSPPAGTALNGFWVCVGTPQNRALYGSAVSTSTGAVSFANLPYNGMIVATVQKAGFTSGNRDWYPSPGQSVNLTIPVTAGSGGYTCPGYTPPAAPPPSTEVKIDATALVALPPGTAPVRLGEETLTARGQFSGDVTTSKSDCTTSSYRNVMIGVEGFMEDTVIKSIRVSCTTVRDAITNERFVPRGYHRTSREFYSRCQSGKVLVGLSGTLIFSQLRSFKVICQTMGNDGRVTGSTNSLAEVGKPRTIPFGPDLCNGGRSGKAVKTASGRMTDGLPAGDTPLPNAVIGIQLVCEQPRID
jgi:hypothetical protein